MISRKSHPARAFRPFATSSPSWPPAGARRDRQSWRTFLQAHGESILAATFTADAVWLRHLYALVFLSIGSRRIEYLACTSKPNTAWVPLKCPAAAEQWLGGSR
jgi:hypothetical protein